MADQRVTKLSIAAACILLLAVSCKKNVDSPSASDGKVMFTSSIEGVNITRAGDASWDANDAIGVFAKNSGGTITDANIKYTTTGNGNFAATGYGINYPVDGSSLSFLAYYPHNATLSGTTYNVNVATQTNPAAIDLMYSSNATGYSQSSTTTPNLNFTHQLSKIELVVKAGTGVSSLTGVTALFQSFYTTAAFDLSTGVLSPGNTQADITARTVTAGVDPVASAIMIPVSNAEGKTVFFGLPNGDNFAWTMGAGIKFESGKKYTYTVTLQKQASGTTAVVLGAATITPWTDVPGGNLTAPQVTANKTKKVLIIGLDGTLNAALTATNAPNIKALMDVSWVSLNAQAEPPTWSAVGWTGILTGTSVTRHMATDNNFTGNDIVNHPSLFKDVAAQYPAMRTAAIVAWKPITDFIVKDATVASPYTDADYVLRDQKVAAQVIDELNTKDPGVLFCHFDNIDHNGHSSGFSTTNTAYTDAIKAVDVHIGNILAAVKNRPTYNQEDWLIMLTSDHGGTGTSHGGNSYLERNSFIIINNSKVAPALINKLPGADGSHTETALQFGSGIYGSLPADLNTKVDFAKGDFTVECRIRKENDSTLNYPPIWGNKNWVSGANVGFVLAEQGGILKFNINAKGGSRADANATGIDLRDKNWHYISVVVNRTQKRAYVYDAGVLRFNLNIAGIGTDSAMVADAVFNIGMDGIGKTGFGSARFRGSITHFRVFNKALSTGVIRANYQNDNITSLHPDYANLMFYAKGNDGSGSVYAGTIGGDITLKNGTPDWGSITASNYTEGDCPMIYSVAPTVLKFLGINIPARYDGVPLVNF